MTISEITARVARGEVTSEKLTEECLATIHALNPTLNAFITETPDGYAITPYDPALEEQLQAGREFMREFRDTFHALAK